MQINSAKNSPQEKSIYVDNSWQMKLKTVQASTSSLKCLFNASQVFMIITIVQQK